MRCRVLLVRLRGLRSRETRLQLRLRWLRPVRCGVLLVRLRGLRLKRLRFQSPHLSPAYNIDQATALEG